MSVERALGMSDLRDWLRSNKLEQYAEMFEAHDIDVDILPDLSEVDLEKLGISLGNRPFDESNC